MPHPNHPLIVIADDITGAAEIAGIGLQFNFQVNLIIYKGEETITPPEQCNMLVIATDTRSMTQTEAIEETARIAKAIKNTGYTRLFKKTDSALRGHIVAELKTLMDITGSECALLLPQNPSRKRTIEKGIYYIHQTPLDKTPFAYDPEYPATTANVSTLLFRKHKGKILTPQQRIKRKGIYLAEAVTAEDVKQRAEEWHEGVLAAGGADFFTAYLIAGGYTATPFKAFEGIKSKHTLIVLGSTSNHILSDFSYIRNQDIIWCNVPRIIFYREVPKRWIEKLKRRYTAHDSLILCVNHPPKKERTVAMRLKEEMGKAVTALLSERIPQELIIAGGTTAFSILKRMDWNLFDITCQVAPGVIRMTPLENQDVTITLKPGSYPWGTLFQ